MRKFAVCSLQLGVILYLFTFTGCKAYSFSGANIAPDIHSFSVELVQNRSGNGPASLPQVFTDKLKFKFQTEANLRQVTRDGDLQFSGAITGYAFTTDAPIAGASSALNKLTISVQVTFSNTKDEKDKWTESFSRYAQYSASENLASVEDGLINTISAQLADDIFQKALVKW